MHPSSSPVPTPRPPHTPNEPRRPTVQESILYSPVASSVDFEDHRGGRERCVSGFDQEYHHTAPVDARHTADLETDPRWSLPSSTEAQVTWDNMPGAFVEIFVTTFEKHEASNSTNTYVSYEILTRSNWPVFCAQEFIVRRRYNDFVWLRAHLQKNFPTVFIPPLPEKNVSGYLDRFSVEFLSKRKRMLERFLHKVSQHPKLRVFPDFHFFLEAKSWAFETLKSSRGPLPKEPSQSTKPVKLRNQDERFNHLHSYVDGFGAHVTYLEKLSCNIQKAKKNLAVGLHDISAALVLLSDTEIETAEGISYSGEVMEQYGKLMDDEAISDRDTFAEPLQHYILYIKAIQVILRERDLSYAHLEELERELGTYNIILPVEETPIEDHLRPTSSVPENWPPAESASQKKGWFWSLFGRRSAEEPSHTDHPVSSSEAAVTQTPTTPSSSDQARAEYIEKLKNDVIQARLEQKKIDAIIIEEYKHFQRNKIGDFKAIIEEYCKSQIAHHAQLAESWGKLVSIAEQIEMDDSYTK